MKKVVTFSFVLALLLPFAIGQEQFWQFEEQYDPFTDENTSYIFLSTLDPGMFDDEALIVKCTPGMTPPFMIGISFNEWVTSGIFSNNPTVVADVRWDRGRTKQETFSMLSGEGTQSLSTGYVLESNRNLWLKNIEMRDQLAIRAVNSSNVLIFEFPEDFIAEMNTLPCLP